MKLASSDVGKVPRRMHVPTSVITGYHDRQSGTTSACSILQYPHIGKLLAKQRFVPEASKRNAGPCEWNCVPASGPPIVRNLSAESIFSHSLYSQRIARLGQSSEAPPTELQRNCRKVSGIGASSLAEIF